MAESNYHRMSEQHINHLRQSDSPQPVDLVHQHQLQIPGDPNPWVVQAALEAHLHQRHQAALVAVQDLERQRLAGSEQHQQPE